MALPQISIIDIIKLKRNNFSFKTENKFCYVLTCRTDGESLFFYGEKEQLVKRGDILYIPEKSSYSQRCDKETLVCFHLNVSGRISSEIKMFSPSDSERDRICNLFIKAEQIWKERPENYELSCMSILYEIMAQIQLFKDDDSKSSAKLLKPAMAYIDTHLCDASLSFEEACSEAHICRTYFNKLFNQTYGCTPTEYINEQRIERGKQLLISEEFSNEEIAYLCGFNDVKYFYVVFKKITGFTTREYKREFENFKNQNVDTEEQ